MGPACCAAECGYHVTLVRDATAAASDARGPRRQRANPASPQRSSTVSHSGRFSTPAAVFRVAALGKIAILLRRLGRAVGPLQPAGFLTWLGLAGAFAVGAVLAAVSGGSTVGMSAA